MRVLAIDPGPTTCGFVVFDGERVIDGEPDIACRDLLALVYEFGPYPRPSMGVAIEWVSNMGMAVGASVFETCYWAGRFDEAANETATRIKRIDVKSHICGNTKAQDKHIRAALIDRFGGIEGKAKAVGTKKSPGPLYGVRTHMWAALAVAVTYHDMHQARNAA